jgi:exopolysaccharide biosynthesis polyprenyl glycosylphosphotransferase
MSGKENRTMRESTMFKADDATRTYTDLILDQEFGLYVAEYFHMALYQERKRRERSKRSMFLMLIDVMRIPEEAQDEAVRIISRRLATLTRETDLKGWYSESQVIGVIFTEFNAFDSQAMQVKIKNDLERSLPPDQMKIIDFSIHEFPREQDVDRCELPQNQVLYPEVTRKYAAKGGPFFMKRIIDIAGSLAGLVLFSPFFLVIPLLIKATSRGPVLFRQQRVGLYGKKFMFLKFRTMYVGNDSRVHEEYIKKLIAGKIDAESGDGASQKPVYKITNDKRVTPIGEFLRKTSLDELPQFINVLLGDMSLVGPRPPIPYEVQNYDIWHRCRVVEVKPGITGLWQVMGRSTTSFDEMVRLDIKYSREWSIWLDLKIIAKTPWSVIKGKGAY